MSIETCNIHSFGDGRIEIDEHETLNGIYALERTCTIESQTYHCDRAWDPYYEVELSCGDLVVWDETYSVGMFCPFCGARVIEEGE